MRVILYRKTAAFACIVYVPALNAYQYQKIFCLLHAYLPPLIMIYIALTMINVYMV